MKQSAIIAIFILTFCSPTPTHSQTLPQNRERAIALWEEAIQAKGGRERLHSIDNFLISSTVDVRDQIRSSETQTERLYVGPEKVWIYRNTPGFDVSLDATLINRDRCWVTLAPNSKRVPGISFCLPETRIQYLVQDPVLYLMETKWIRPVPIGVRTEKQLDVIETSVGGLRVDFYLDRKTRLPIKVVTDWYGGLTQASGHLGPMTVELRKYVEVDGIQMPTKVTRELDGNGTGPVGEPYRLDTERAAYQFNVTYNPRIFDTPIPKAVKRHDWKLE